MINNFISKTNSGLYCAAGDFYIDPKRAVSKALVSHAHSDHAVATTGEVYCTHPTRSFMQHRHQGRSQPSYKAIKFEEVFHINDVKITFYPAGHILGSAQILMEYSGERYLYTGDFKVQSDESCESFRFVECDHLITETTFASPEYHHPDPLTEIRNLLGVSKNVIIGAYSLGKAQRLTQLITKNFSDVSVFIHPDLEVYHNLYSDHGIYLGDWLPFRRNDFFREQTSIYIVPPAFLRKRAGDATMLRVFATGWKRSFYRCDRILQISDHADWNGILELVRKSKAKKVYTVHGNGSILKEYLRDQIEVNIIG